MMLSADAFWELVLDIKRYRVIFLIRTHQISNHGLDRSEMQNTTVTYPVKLTHY